MGAGRPSTGLRRAGLFDGDCERACGGAAAAGAVRATVGLEPALVRNVSRPIVAIKFDSTAESDLEVFETTGNWVVNR